MEKGKRASPSFPPSLAYFRRLSLVCANATNISFYTSIKLTMREIYLIIYVTGTFASLAKNNPALEAGTPLELERNIENEQGCVLFLFFKTH
jgi:hypothetical protein